MNYWPHSKNKTAHLKGEKASKTGVAPVDAIKMAAQNVELPPIVHQTTKGLRNKNYAAARANLLAVDNRCHWCKQVLIVETSTIDHVVPLNRGGADTVENWVVACADCNASRGSHMPELQGFKFENKLATFEALSAKISEVRRAIHVEKNLLVVAQRLEWAFIWRGEPVPSYHLNKVAEITGRWRTLKAQHNHYQMLRFTTRSGQYEKAFVEAARRMLPVRQFAHLEQQAKEIQSDNLSQSSGGQLQPADRRASHHDALAIPAIYPCGVDDAPGVLPECEQ